MPTLFKTKYPRDSSRLFALQSVVSEIRSVVLELIADNRDKKPEVSKLLKERLLSLSCLSELEKDEDIYRALDKLHRPGAQSPT